MNCKGAERILFMVFILIVIIISTGITGGMYIFFNQGYDLRNQETTLLMSYIKECLSKEDLQIKNFDIYSECGLNRNFIEDGYLISIDDGNNKVVYGMTDLEIRCGLNIVDRKQRPYCLHEIIPKDNLDVIIASVSHPTRRIDG